MPAWLIGLGLKLSPVGAFLKAVPRQVWIALAVAALVVGGYVWHGHKVHAALKAADAAGYARARSEDAAALAKLKQRVAEAEASARAISDDTRSKNDEANRSIADDARDLGLRGPGAARCRSDDHPAVPAASSQPVAPDHQSADASAGAVSGSDGQPDLAAVPWRWLVGRAEQCDIDRAEAMTWRDWYQRQSAEWAKLRSAVTAR